MSDQEPIVWVIIRGRSGVTECQANTAKSVSLANSRATGNDGPVQKR